MILKTWLKVRSSDSKAVHSQQPWDINLVPTMLAPYNFCDHRNGAEEHGLAWAHPS